MDALRADEWRQVVIKGLPARKPPVVTVALQ
jgi:hypothetical protein